MIYELSLAYVAVHEGSTKLFSFFGHLKRGEELALYLITDEEFEGTKLRDYIVRTRLRFYMPLNGSC